MAGWLSAWREDRRRKQAAARRPQAPRLLPAFDPFEDRSFLGPNFTMLLQVGLVGTGAAIFGELLHQAFTRVDPLPAASRRAPRPAGGAAPGSDLPRPPVPRGGGGGGSEGGGRGWADPLAVAAESPRGW